MDCKLKLVQWKFAVNVDSRKLPTQKSIHDKNAKISLSRKKTRYTVFFYENKTGSLTESITY